MSWGSYGYDSRYYLGAEPAPGRTASSYREHRGPIVHQPVTHPQPQPQPRPRPRRHHFHDYPPYPHRYYNDYVIVEGWGWWPRWFPYWDQRWFDYWWYLYDYYGGDAYPDYAEYARDAVIRQYAPQWGLVISGNYGPYVGQQYGETLDDQRRRIANWRGPMLPSTSSNPRNYYGLEEALMDGLTRRALATSSRYARDPNVPAVAYLRLKGGEEIVLPYPSSDWLDSGSPIRQWWQGLTGLRSGYGDSNFGAWEFAAIIAFDPKTRQAFANSYALSPVIVGPLRALEGAA
jgi:hypothetical protein